MDSVLNTSIMSKIIQSHIECGHRIGSYCYYNRSLEEDVNICEPKGILNFPDNCPLEEGIPIEQGTLYTKVHKHKEPKK